MSYSAYLETQVLSASPVELIALMYRGSIGFLESARIHLATGDIAARSSDVSRACGLIGELAQSVSDLPDPEFANQLRELYGYILLRVQEGNFHQTDAPLAEAIRLLNTLLEGWQEIDGNPHRIDSSVRPEEHQPLQYSF
ncbi:MAG: flagellar protein FliS [Bryobacterales bacterium]|nr:flagellar protein FliS [Bryobacterales bacterium]